MGFLFIYKYIYHINITKIKVLCNMIHNSCLILTYTTTQVGGRRRLTKVRKKSELDSTVFFLLAKTDSLKADYPREKAQALHCDLEIMKHLNPQLERRRDDFIFVLKLFHIFFFEFYIFYFSWTENSKSKMLCWIKWYLTFLFCKTDS